MDKLKTNIIIFSLLAMICGTLLHFTYEWFKGPVFYLISATDESVFSHLKLVFWPLLLLGIFEYFTYGKKYPRFIYSRIVALTIAIVTILTVFYTYTGITGQSNIFIDIPLFFVAIGLSYFYTYKSLLNTKELPISRRITSYSWLCILLFSFIFFSYHKLDIPLFIPSEAYLIY